MGKYRLGEIATVEISGVDKKIKDGVPAVVKTIEYDPNRSARIALLFLKLNFN